MAVTCSFPDTNFGNWRQHGSTDRNLFTHTVLLFLKKNVAKSYPHQAFCPEQSKTITKHETALTRPILRMGRSIAQCLAPLKHHVQILAASVIPLVEGCSLRRLPWRDFDSLDLDESVVWFSGLKVAWGNVISRRKLGSYIVVVRREGILCSLLLLFLSSQLHSNPAAGTAIQLSTFQRNLEVIINNINETRMAFI